MREENNFAFALETPYFGPLDNKVSEARLIELGHCLAKALKRYIKEGELYYQVQQ